MKHIDRGILGDGFYPGASGTTNITFPVGKVMLVGRDFGTMDYYERLCGNPPRSETALTWRHTKKIYLEIFDSADVWCTNYLMGVRVNGSAKGNVAPSMDPQSWLRYEATCWDFFLKQVELQKPALIIIFGDDNQIDLSRASRIGSPLKAIPFADGEGSLCDHMFQLKSGPHTARIHFLKHPHSAIGPANAAAVRAQAIFANKQFHRIAH
jgi:hypothetical protein